ncbi:uncharacterized protein LOC109602454 isoform X2 [Aethina tumida]|uniref:uncharacterized protein LOC109602454 isoform X2 n=1 Tax=Aethina tumida TaxID=116153 RepID=UPI00096AF49C|nr:uncharacterized protein LOC109602454 isoform X2 [Aethina tumida]
MENEVVEHTIDDESQDSEINVIPVQLVEPYESVILSSPTNSSNISRGKYYKQTYRPAWEEMPDFKGWLRGVEGEPTRAYCIYCQKTLHAHRLSLLKHTCTLRHQKAAQLFNVRKNKDNSNMEQEIHQVLLQDTKDMITQEDIEGEGETIVEYAETTMEDADQENEEIEDEEDGEESVQFRKFQTNQLSISKPPISTHVIDTTRGSPVSGLQVSLYKLIDGRWTYINEGVTNTSGRFSQFLDRSDFTPGRYKLHYDVDRYFESRRQETLYPFIEVVFDSALYSDHYHIPMLLSPFGYSTYKGS